MIAYHHWLNNDNLMNLFYKLGLCKDAIEWKFYPEKKKEQWIKKQIKEQNCGRTKRV